MTDLNIGIIGFGHWAQTAYVPTLRDMPAVRLAAVAARTSATRNRARELLGEVAAVGDYREILADDSIDAVMVAVPNELPLTIRGQPSRSVFASTVVLSPASMHGLPIPSR